MNPRPLVPEPRRGRALAWGSCPPCLSIRHRRRTRSTLRSILRALPERERETFLAEYRRAVDDARDPARWPELRRFLRLWAWRAVAVAEPGYYESWERANAGTDGGMLLEDAIKLYGLELL